METLRKRKVENDRDHRKLMGNSAVEGGFALLLVRHACWNFGNYLAIMRVDDQRSDPGCLVEIV